MTPASIVGSLLPSNRVEARAKSAEGLGAPGIAVTRDECFADADVKLIERLLDSGKCDANEPDPNGHTAMDLATGRLHVVPEHSPRITSMRKTVVVSPLLSKYGAIVPEKMKETQDPWR